MKPVSDFTFYWYAAEQFVNGRNPYTCMPGRAYSLFAPPWSLAVLFPFGFLPLGLAEIVWTLLLIALISISATWFWKTYAEDCNPIAAYFLLFVFTPVWATMKLGQTSPFVLFGLAGFLRYRVKHPYLAGALLFFTAFKPQLTFLIWPALVLAGVFEREWKPLLGFGVVLVAATVAILAARTEVFTEYSVMLRVQRVAYYETSTIGTLLRHVSRVEWMQFVPSVFGLAWFARHWTTRRRSWDWAVEMPMLVLVSIISTWYAWFTDEVIMIPVLFSVVATIGKQAWERPALFYLSLNVAGIALAVGHHIYLQTWIPILWLAYLLKDQRFLRAKEIEQVDTMAAR
jgi:hypothetical protein